MNNQNPFGGNGFNSPVPDFSSFQNGFFKFVKRWLKYIILLVIVALLSFDSIYTLRSSEKAAITRFGKYIFTEETAGLRFKLPLIDRAHIVNTGHVRSLEFGYRSHDPNNEIYVDSEARMITSDLNIVIADWAVLYQVNNVYNYLFNVEDPEGTLRIIAESTYRRVVANHPLDDILTDQKDIMQNEIRVDLQKICDKYEMGVIITAVQLQDAMPPDQVNDSFQDVTRAKEEKEAMINEASKYENERLPIARGEAESLINEALGYKEKRINEALGNVARYKAVASEYESNPSIMRIRLYQEMIRDVLPHLKHIYIVDQNGDTLQFLPIGQNN